MHKSKVVCADTDAPGKLLLTMDATGTSILWNSETLEPIRFFLAEDVRNENYSCAISDDGSLVAFATSRLFVFETANGRLFAQLNDFLNEITTLHFVSDQLLAVGTSNAETIILRTSTLTIEHRLSHKSGTPVAIDVDAAGWLAVLCKTGIEMYDNNFNLNKAVQFPAGMIPASIRFSPDGSRIAVGFSSAHLPLVFDASELSDPAHPRFLINEVNAGAFRYVDYSRDGMYLLASGDAKINLLRSETDIELSSDRNGYFVGRWSRMGTGDFEAIAAGNVPITSIIALPGGCLVYADSSPAVVKVGATRLQTISRIPAHNSFGIDTAGLILVNANADELIINYENIEPLRLSLRHQLFEFQRESTSLTWVEGVKHELPGLKLTNWKNSVNVIVNGVPLTWIKDGDTIRFADVANHGLRFVLGSDRTIYCGGRKGDLIWKKNFQEPVRYLNISGNARVLVAALADGRLIWIRMSDGKTLLQFSSYNSNQYWSFASGSGFVELNTEPANKVFGLSLKRQDSVALSFVPSYLLDSAFFRPGISAAVSLEWDEEELYAREGIQVPDFSAYLHTVLKPELLIPSVKEVKATLRFHLIVASFPQSDLAIRHVGQLVAMGYSEARSLRSDGRYRVSIQSFSSFDEAARRRNDLENQFEGIWILENDDSRK